MKTGGQRIWVVLFMAVLLLGGYLYYTVQSNREQLQDQSIRSLELTRENILDSWDNYQRGKCNEYSTSVENLEKISNERLRGIIDTLLTQMQPSEFFDLTIVADSKGDILATKPDHAVHQIPAYDPSDSTSERNYGIARTEMTISARDYQVFRTPVLLRLDICKSDTISEIVLYGAVAQETFTEAGWQIKFIVLYTLLSLVVLIIVSYPIIKIIGMGRGDTLSRAQVYQTGLSLILVSMFIGFSISYLVSRDEIKKDLESERESVRLSIGNLVNREVFKKDLVRFIGFSVGNLIVREKIKEDLKCEKESFNFLLRRSERTVIGFCIGNWVIREEIKENKKKDIESYIEILKEFKRGYLHNKNEIEDSLSSKPFKENDYLKQLFVIDQEGWVSDMVERDENGNTKILSFQDLLKKPNLKQRHYVQRAGTEEYYIGSHFSYSDRNHEGVISIKEADTVYALTHNFDFIDRQDSTKFNRSGLKYLVINERGEVLYQPKSVSTSITDIQDAINSLEWEEMRELMQQNKELDESQKLTLKITFEGQVYRAHLNRMPFTKKNVKNTFWAVTFEDPNLLSFRSYSAFMFSGVGYFFLVILFLLISLFTNFSRVSSNFLNLKTSTYGWFRPLPKKKWKEYTLLNVIIFLNALFFLWLIVYGHHHNLWLDVLLFGETICFVAFAKFILISDYIDNDKNKNKAIPGWKFLVPLFLLIFICIVLLYQLVSISSNNNSGFVVTIIFFHLIIGLFITFLQLSEKFWQWAKKTFSFFKGNFYKRVKLFLQKPESLYPVTFLGWIFLVGMLPGFAVHHSASHFENTLWSEASGQEQSVDPNKINPDQHRFINIFEYTRRQWLINYTGLEYRAIKKYINPQLSSVEYGLFSNENVQEGHEDHEGHKDHVEKSWLEKVIIVAGFVLSLIALFSLISYLTKRIFLTEYWDYGQDKDINPEMVSQSQLYLITLDNQQAVKELKKNFLKDKKFKELNLSSQTDRKKLKEFKDKLVGYNGIVFLNIEGILNTVENINHLTGLISVCKKNKKFVLMTGSKSIRDLRGTIIKKDDPSFEQAFFNLLDTISDFFTQIIPIQDEEKSIAKEISEFNLSTIKSLKNEVQYGPHTKELIGILKQKKDPSQKRKEREKFILKVQRYNKAYYQSIWEKFTFREKQMVHNFANEGFVNYCNVDVLTELMQKGIFKMDQVNEQISLFNQSFRNFATQAASAKLEKEMKKDEKENGNIRHIRNAVLTIIFMTILAVSLLAPELIDRYIGALSGSLAVLSSLASFTGKLSGKIPFLSKES